MPPCVPFGAFPPTRAAALLGYSNDSPGETEDRRPICHNLLRLIENMSGAVPKGGRESSILQHTGLTHLTCPTNSGSSGESLSFGTAPV